MNRTLPLFLALVGLSVSGHALADAPCTTYAGLADVDRDGYCGLVGTATPATSGWTGKVDCRDDIATINPGGREIVGDGIDQDCNGSDAVFPVPEATATRYLANSGTIGPLAFIVEYGACDTAAECEVDDVAGTMQIKPSNLETHRFMDIYVNGTKVLRNHGQPADGREVVTVEEASHFRGGSSGSGGVGKSYVDASAGVLRQETAKEKEERLAADAEHDRRIGELQTTSDALVDAVNDHTGQIVDLESALAAETTAREAAYAAVLEDIVDLQAADVLLTDGVNLLQSHGPLFEGYAMGNLMAGESVGDNGEIARNAAFGGGGAGVNVGVDGDGFRANAFVETAFGSDGADGVSSNWAAGGEYLWQVSDVGAHLGINVGYAQRSSLVNALETQVLGRMPMVGGTLAAPIGQGERGQHGLFLIRADVGPEFIGMASDNVTDAVRFGGRVTMGFGFGVGALQ